MLKFKLNKLIKLNNIVNEIRFGKVNIKNEQYLIKNRKFNKKMNCN